MSEESRNIEKAENAGQEVKPAELAEQELENVAGGGVYVPKAGEGGIGLKSW